MPRLHTHAQLASLKDLRAALELLPLMYVLSGAMFGVAEHKLRKLKEQQAAVQLAQQGMELGISGTSSLEDNGPQHGAK